MAYQALTLPMKDFGGGIDQQSSESLIAPGYVESALNADPKATGQIVKRQGYQGFAGEIPLRCTKIQQSGTSLYLSFDSTATLSAIDLSNVRSSPLVVYGITSAATSGDFTTTATARYYSSFTVQNKDTLSSGTSTYTKANFAGAPFVAVNLMRSTSSSDNSNELVEADSVSIDQSSGDITIGYSNGTGASVDVFTGIIDKTAVAGSVYVSGTQSISSGANTVTITAATHGLANRNIAVLVYRDTGTAWEQVQPDSTTINTSGDVIVSIAATSSWNAKLVLTSLDLSNSATTTATGGATTTLEFDVTSPFLRAVCYIEQTPGGTLEQVLPNSLTIDASTLEASMTFVNGGSTANIFVYWEYCTVLANRLLVTATNSDTYTDTSPQITVWGLSHSEIYTSEVTRGGWVTHLDSYKAADETQVVAGLGGNLFRAGPQETYGTSYLLPSRTPRLIERVNSTTVIGPAFWGASDSPSRTRGYIKFTGGDAHLATATTFAYNSGTGLVDVTVSVPSATLSTSLSTIISAGDWLTVSQAGQSVHNGSFRISTVTQPTASTLLFSIDNEEVTSSDYNESNSGALAGVFSDRLTGSATSALLPDDALSCDAFSDDTQIIVSETSGTTIYLNQVEEEISIPSTARLSPTRTARVWPLTDFTNSASINLNIVRGDLLSFTGVERLFRAVYVNADSSRTVGITCNGTTATVTMAAGSTAHLHAGQRVLFTNAGVYSGEQEIEEILSSTTFSFLSEETATVAAGTLLGNTVEVDEDFEDFAGSFTSAVEVNVEYRWIPIEAPTDSFDLTDTTYTYHLDANGYAEQPFLRSVMVQDSLYLTNGEDEVMKYDGTNLYQAGLPRWQPQLFLSIDTAASATIAYKPVQATVTARSGNVFTVGQGYETQFVVGDRISHSNDSAKYTIVAIGNDGPSGNGLITVNATISGAAAGTINLIQTRKYYYRLNAVDANKNLLATAVVGSEDYVVELTAAAAVYHRLVGLPAIGIYDYARLEVEIYGTKTRGTTFYKIATLPLSFNNSDGYLDYTDTASDDTLIDLDPINSVLKGQELGTTFERPLRAKYVTSFGNRLILGNLTGDPTLDIRYLSTGSRITTSILNGLITTFRKDATSSSTTTDNTNVMRFQFKTSSTTITPSTDIANNSGTTFTVTSAAHGLVVGDWVYLFHDSGSSGKSLQYAGWFQVASRDTNTFTCKLTHSASYTPGTADVTAWTAATTKSDIPVFLGTDNNYQQLNGNDTAAGAPYEAIAIRRLANAINAVQRKVDVAVETDFEPWLIAAAGSEYEIGQLVVTQPKVFDTTLEVTLPAFSTNFNVFVNSVKQSSGGTVSASTRLYPSRLLVSYNNFPEIFDAPTALSDTSSESAIDVNSADGQEITAVIPFFGDSAFGSSLKDGVIIVFKANSIYAVNIGAKAEGINPVQKLESQGLGCTAPYSVAATKDGIIFANNSGIFRLNRSLQLEYVGQKIERLWKEEVDQDLLTLMHGTHFGIGRQYKLSVPVEGDTYPTNVFVYDHTREYNATSQFGSWTRYDNHKAIGWANLGADAFWASTVGRVFLLRQTGLASDYRDDNEAVDMEVVFAATDFGDAGLRKVIPAVIAHFRMNGTNTEGTSLSSALDLSETFVAMDAFELNDPGLARNNLSDSPTLKAKTLKFVSLNKKCVYYQLKLTNSTIDEPVELTQLSIRVAGISDKGIQDAKATVG